MTKFNLQEFKTLEKIKLSYLKHRGNILEIAKDLEWSDDPDKIIYIKKAIKKIKGSEDRTAAVLIANTLMQHMLMGYESRTHHLMEVLKALEGRDKDKLSVCCEMPVKPNPAQEGKWVCMACNKKEAEVMVVDNEGMVDLKLATIESLREEDAAMVDFAEVMGYTNKPPEEKVPHIKQNIIILPGNSGGNAEIVKDLNEMTPMARDILVDKLQKQIVGEAVDAEFTSEAPKNEET